MFLSGRTALRCARTQSVWQAAPSWEGESFRTETQKPLLQRPQETWKSSVSQCGGLLNGSTVSHGVGLVASSPGKLTGQSH